MKKVLVTGAALLIAGSMVSAAGAEVNLSGDARVRYVGTTDYDRYLKYDPATGGTINEESNGYRDNFNSRIRVKLDAKAAGGAFMKVRMRFDDMTWDGQGWGAWKNGKNVWADYAYIGVPMGPVTFTGGRMPADFSKFFSWDNRPTRVKLDWKSGAVRVIGLVDVIDEFTNNVEDEWNDNDFMAYGLVASFKINDDWSVKGYARYHDDQRDWNVAPYTLDPVHANDPRINNDPGAIESTYHGVYEQVPQVGVRHNDRSGFLGSVHVQGKVAMGGLEGEIAYKEGDVQGTADDGWGWYLKASMDMGAFTPAAVIGMTTDGYQADDDFGFIMIGAAEPITVIDRIGTGLGDSFFAALTANYAISDRFRVAGNLVYYDIDLDEDESGQDVRGLADAVEISGSATYVISEGADLTYKMGLLSPSYDGRLNSVGISDDAYFGHYLRMAIKF
jgi:hypothetical protein